MHNPYSKPNKTKQTTVMLKLFLKRGGVAWLLVSSMLLFFVSIPGQAQSSTKGNVTGTIVDAAGLPVIGAGITVVGTTIGTASDSEGKFVLQDIEDGTVLEISSIGYVTQRVTVTSRRVIQVTLEEDSELLSEVVITGFGLAQKKATMTGAISAINGDILSTSVATNTSGALAGKIAGVNFRKSDNRPGRGTNMEIRNMGTPLYVIDGIVKDQDQFNYLDYNDIESISILKDASAAIYGVRAANGVVVVTTKRGTKNSKNTVNITYEHGWGRNSQYPMPADVPTYLTNYIQSQTIKGVTNYKYSASDLAKWTAGTEKGYIPFDWYDFIWGTANQQLIKADITGGSDKSNYYISFSHTDEETSIKAYDGFHKNNVQINLDTWLTDKFKIGVTMSGHIRQIHNPGVPQGNDYYMPAYATFMNLPTIHAYANDNPNYPAYTSTDSGTNFAILNYELAGERLDSWRTINLGTDAEYEVFDGLKLKALLSYYYQVYYMNNQEYTYTEYSYDEATDTYPIAVEMTNPWKERETDFTEETTSNLQMNYDKTFGPHHVAAVVGFEASLRKTPGVWIHSRPVANTLHLFDYTSLDTYTDTGENPRARLGWLGRFNYDFAGKYLVELSGRYNGSWKFPPGHRWGFFPAASVGWRVSEEDFWKGSNLANVINSLKLRASYGVVGDDNTSGYSAFDYMSGYTYKSGSGVIDGAYVVGTTARGLPVTTLSWLKAKTLDIGLDASFLNNRLDFQADYFNRLRTGIPAGRYDILIPSEVGFSLPNENLNSDLTRGVDFGIRWHDQIGDFGYNFAVNFTYSRYYNWDSYKPRFSNSWDKYRNSTEHRYANVYWGYESLGQFQSWEEIANYPIDNDGKGNTTLRPGDIKYKDQNGDGFINSMDYRPIGYYNQTSYTSTTAITPIWTGGIDAGLTWKNFRVDMDFIYGGGYSWLQNYWLRTPFYKGGNAPQFYMEDTWHLADIWNADSEYLPGKYPMIIEGNSGHSDYWASDFWLYNVHYLKLKNLQFSYTFNPSLINRIRLSGLTLYASCSNVFQFTNLPSIDVETVSQTSWGPEPPSLRTITVGAKVKF